jgi:ribosomal protein S18 acetylase RimI-like enzyme
MIRPTAPADTPALLALATSTGVFKPLEIEALQEVLDDYHAVNHTFNHRSVVCEVAGRPVGFAYHAPAAMTDRAWYLYWIAVDPGRQGQGLGGEMLRYVEEDIRRAGGRLLLIETSSLPHYDLTRRFYAKQGYDEAARVADFYADGDSMVVFSKRLLGGKS